MYRTEFKHYANNVNTTKIRRLKIKELNNIFFSKSGWHLFLLESHCRCVFIMIKPSQSASQRSLITFYSNQQSKALVSHSPASTGRVSVLLILAIFFCKHRMEFLCGFNEYFLMTSHVECFFIYIWIVYKFPVKCLSESSYSLDIIVFVFIAKW